jgi:hypothetical protein
MSVIVIRQYINGERKDTFGLEKYGMSKWEGSKTILAVPYRNGRWITGLDEESTEIAKISDPKKREATKKEVINYRKELEKNLGVDLSNANDEYWSAKLIRIESAVMSLDTKDPEQAVTASIIKANWDNPRYQIARNYEEAVSPSLPSMDYKFYISEEEKDSNAKVSRKIEIANAKAILMDLFNKNPDKLLKVAKYILANSYNFKPSSPKTMLFDKLDQYIDGEFEKDNKKATPGKFTEVANLHAEDLNTAVLVKDAMYYNVIRLNPKDKQYYCVVTNTELGRNVTEITASLMNPKFSEDYLKIQEEVEKRYI